jgi:hypothetical protein
MPSILLLGGVCRHRKVDGELVRVWVSCLEDGPGDGWRPQRKVNRWMLLFTLRTLHRQMNSTLDSEHTSHMA